MDISLTLLSAPAVRDLPLEIAERKGLGHPDAICDALAENLSATLSRFYLERCGAVLHHNVDKGLLCGGAARPAFGGGEVLEPIEIYLTGRATAEHRGAKIPVDRLAIDASRAWLRSHIRHLDAERHVRIIPRIRPTSPSLAALFARQREAGAPLANDTSCGAGFAPLDDLERTVLAVERKLNSREAKQLHPEIGEDIKVMGVRRGAGFHLTVACALVGRHVAGLAEYRAGKARIRDLALQEARMITRAAVDAQVNTADGDSFDSIYLTVTGLSAESGDDGQVGRGNRVNGLITPYRPMSLEAVAGKNPISHVGKLYNVIAHRIACALVAEVPGVEEAYCFLVSRIGCPISEPQAFDVKVRLADAAALDALRPQLVDLARTEFGRIGSIWRAALDGSVQVY